MNEITKLLFSESFDFKEAKPTPTNDLKLRFRNYSKVKNTKWGWVLSRLVVGHNEISTSGILSSHQDSIPKPIPITISVPPSLNNTDFKNFISSIERELMDVHNQRLGELKTDVLEVNIPIEAIKKKSVKEIIDSFEYIIARMSTNKIFPEKTYFEIPSFDNDIELLKLVLKIIAKHNDLLQKKKPDFYEESGFKLIISDPKTNEPRSLKYLAAVILFTRDLNLELIFSNENFSLLTSTDTNNKLVQVGLLNLFASCLLSYSSDLNASEIIKILSDSDLENFELNEDSLKWKEFKVTSTELKMLRKVVLPSFSSSNLKTTIESIASL